MPALLAVRLEVLVVVLLAVVGARLVRARNDRVAVVCHSHPVQIKHCGIHILDQGKN